MTTLRTCVEVLSCIETIHVHVYSCIVMCMYMCTHRDLILYMKIHVPIMLAIGVDKHTTNKQAATMASLSTA